MNNYTRTDTCRKSRDIDATVEAIIAQRHQERITNYTEMSETYTDLKYPSAPTLVNVSIAIYPDNEIVVCCLLNDGVA